MKILIQTVSLTLILTLNLLQISQLQAQCNIDDWTALKALYESTDGNNWTNNTGWSQVIGAMPPANCDLEVMHGVTLESGRVSNVNLYNNQLNGSIPFEIGNLNYLRNLNLSSNQLSGNIPPGIGNLNFLTNLYLSGNQLSSIPSEIENLNFLEVLNLSSNQLSSIPSEIGNLNFLRELYLSSNQLTSIPPEIWSLNFLTHLYIDNNQLSSIPPGIGNLNNLTHLYIDNNELSGSIPSEIWNLNNLTYLFLDYNQFTGSIPSEIGNLSNLTQLRLYKNLFTGSIPPEIGNLSNLNDLRLYDNLLSGSIPPEIGNLNNLTLLYLNDNLLSGSIPPEIGNLSNLTYLNLCGNLLSGCYDENLMSLCGQLSPLFNTCISSYGNNFDAPWEDFCNTGAGKCDNGVFPGDCNTDGIVNTEDALYWGLAEGFNGISRPNATTNCSLQACNDWSQSVDGINSKHQDGDGNGTINDDDLQVIISNYGCINDYTTPNYASGAPIYHIQPQGINDDDQYQYDLYVEDGSGAAAIAHGLSFTVSADAIPVSAITINTTGSSLNPDKEFIIPDGNQCHVVLTRTNKSDETCSGPIATFLVETDDVPVGVPFEIDIAFGSKIKADATLDNITGASAFGMYNGTGANSSNLLLNASVTHEQCNGLGEAFAIPSGGTLPYTYTWSTGASGPQVNNLASGSYTVIVTDANGLNQSLTVQINGQTPIYDANGNLLCGNLCPEYLAPSGITGSGLYSASNTLNSDATIPTGNTAEYKAGQIIELKSGFEVQPNASFSAEIDDCQ